MIRTRYFFILLFTIGLFASYYGSQLTGKETPLKKQDAENLLEIYLTQTRSSQLDDKGLLQATVSAKSSKKFSLNKDLQLLDPQIGFYQQPQPWTLSADSASFNAINNSFILQDNVILYRQDEKAKLTTSVLLIDNTKRLATTEAKVKIRFNSSQTDAQGITINMQDDTLLLPANVKTTIHPKGKSVNAPD